MIVVFLRECVVLLLGVGVSLIASLLANAGRDFGALAAAILLPVTFCLIRAALVRYPHGKPAPFRRGGFRVAIGVALVFLLLFEMGLAFFAGADGIPIVWWVVVVGFGAAYVLLFCVAHLVASSQKGGAGR
jgi:hypothetical protein